MIRQISNVTVLCFCAGALFLAEAVVARGQIPADSLWAKGKAAAEAGNYKLALEYWEGARNGPDYLPDPRIGIDYIRLVTGQELTGHYIKATGMYYWGFSGPYKEKFREYLAEEIERIAPLMPRDAQREMKNLLKDSPATASERLTAFWNMMDPTAGTPYNERLIEHWQRIFYVQEHYKRGRSTAYDADERALIYVRLGEPDYVKKGHMPFNSGLARAWIQDFLTFTKQSAPVGIQSQFSADSASGRFGQGGGGTGFSRAFLEQARIESYLREARFLHRYPYYEIWKYQGNEDLYYIFGQDGDTGRFGLLSSLEDMIPNQAFRHNTLSGSPLTSGILLQLMFYEQTSIAGGYFAEAYQNMESQLLPGNFHRLSSFAFRSNHQHRLRYIQNRAPQERSTYLEQKPGIRFQVYQYRLLDRENRPVLATYVESRPHRAYYFDLVTGRGGPQEGIRDYQVHHYLVLTDENKNMLGKQYVRSPVYLTEEGDVDQMKQSVAYFTVPNAADEINQLFTVELHNRRMAQEQISDDLFPENIRALGRHSTGQPSPLDSDPARLEMSDLIIGIKRAERGFATRGGRPPAFEALHDRRIPYPKNMMVHFEVYHLSSDRLSPVKFKVEYQITPRSRNIFKRLFGKGKTVSLTLNLETSENRFQEDLEIITAPFKPGKYKLSLQITEPATGRETGREVEFTIVEPLIDG